MTNTVDGLVDREYAFGFHSDIQTDRAPKGLTEETIRFISAKKNEPEWMLDWRLGAYRHFITLRANRPGTGDLPGDRLPGHVLLGGTQAQG